MGVLVICVLVFTVFCIVSFFLSILVYGTQPPSENSITESNNDDDKSDRQFKCPNWNTNIPKGPKIQNNPYN